MDTIITSEFIPAMTRIILERQTHPHSGQYIARLEDGGEVVRNTRTPLYDSARELLRRGYPGDTLLTMRHAGSAIDAWTPTAIGELAQWTIKEPGRGRIQRVRWQPWGRSEHAPPAYPEPARIDVEAPPAIPAPPEGSEAAPD